MKLIWPLILQIFPNAGVYPRNWVPSNLGYLIGLIYYGLVTHCQSHLNVIDIYNLDGRLQYYYIIDCF